LSLFSAEEDTLRLKITRKNMVLAAFEATATPDFEIH